MRIPFVLEAIDIFVRAEVRQQRNQTIGLPSAVRLIEGNSLKVLQQLCDHNARIKAQPADNQPSNFSLEKSEARETAVLYDIVLVDGDHNFETVSRECELLQSLTHPQTIFLFDDVDSTKHGTTDIYYSTMSGYENNKYATPKPSEEGTVQGVAAAVNNFQRQKGYVSWKIWTGAPRLVADPNNALFLTWAAEVLGEEWPRTQTLLNTHSFQDLPLCLDMTRTPEASKLPPVFRKLYRDKTANEKEKE